MDFEIISVELKDKNKLYNLLQFTLYDSTQYIDKDIETENIIENIILRDVAWNKTEETYLSDEEVWQVSYFFEI